MNCHQAYEELIQDYYAKALLKPVHEKSYKLTPFIVTFCEGNLTTIDIRNFLELGMKIIRFKMTHLSKRDRIIMLQMLKDALQWCCEKYAISTWPISISIDIPNSIITTGYLKALNHGIHDSEIEIKEDWIVELTADRRYRKQCTTRRIYINDSYTIKTVPVGTEIFIRFGRIVLIVTEIVNERTLTCKVLRGDTMGSLEFVCIRGVKYLRPALSKIDMELIKFAMEFQLDIITINALRSAVTLKRIRKYFTGIEIPLIISTISEQEGLDNIDEIIKVSDGIILAREFLACQIVDPYKMVTIQLQLSAKCKKHGIPFFISGDILERTLLTGTISGSDVDDITNAVLHGSGFVLKNYKDPAHVTQGMRYLDEICKGVESFTSEINDFWTLVDMPLVPVNAAEACIIGCALMAKVTQSDAIIIVTKTGQTAIRMSRITPESLILTITRNPMVAKKLQIHRGIVPITYDKPPKDNWYDEIDERIKFAVNYGVKSDIFRYQSRYVAFKKSTPTSAYLDSMSTWPVQLAEHKKNVMNCLSTIELMDDVRWNNKLVKKNKA